MAVINSYVSNETYKMIVDNIDERLNHWASHYSLERALVHAIAGKESDKIFSAIRLEPHLKKTKWYLAALPDKHKKNDFAYCSMGVMQIMYATAVSLGFTGEPFDLMLPDNSIHYGCKMLKNLWKKHKDIDKVISSYNQGSPRTTINSKGKKVFKNQAYVDGVKKRYIELDGMLRN